MRMRIAIACLAACLLAPAALSARPATLAIDAPTDGSAPSRPVVAALVTRTTPAPADSVRPIDYLWVVRTSLVDSASIRRVVARARKMGARGLLVQVVGRGDAWYGPTCCLRPRRSAIRASIRSDCCCRWRTRRASRCTRG